MTTTTTLPAGGSAPGHFPKGVTMTTTALHTCPATKAPVALTTFPNGRAMVSFLTACCGAAGDADERGIICKECHKVVAPVYGMAVMTDDARLRGFVVDGMASLGCPIANDCADLAVAKVEAEVAFLAEAVAA